MPQNYRFSARIVQDLDIFPTHKIFLHFPKRFKNRLLRGEPSGQMLVRETLGLRVSQLTVRVNLFQKSAPPFLADFGKPPDLHDIDPDGAFHDRSLRISFTAFSRPTHSARAIME